MTREKISKFMFKVGIALILINSVYLILYFAVLFFK